MLTEDVDLFAALRPELDSEMLQVTWGRPSDAALALAAIAPWPWAVAGNGDEAPLAAIELLAARPVLWFWLGVAPAGLPAHTRAHARWRDLMTDTRACLTRSVGGVRLAPNRGLLGPDADLILSAELEGLVASAPLPMRLSSRSIAPARRVLARQRLPISVVQGDRGVQLVADG